MEEKKVRFWFKYDIIKIRLLVSMDRNMERAKKEMVVMLAELSS